MNILDEIIALKEKHSGTLCNKPDNSWLDQFLQEVSALILSVYDKHKHSPDAEHVQIAPICIKWPEMHKAACKFNRDNQSDVETCQ